MIALVFMARLLAYMTCYINVDYKNICIYVCAQTFSIQVVFTFNVFSLYDECNMIALVFMARLLAYITCYINVAYKNICIYVCVQTLSIQFIYTFSVFSLYYEFIVFNYIMHMVIYCLQ